MFARLFIRIITIFLMIFLGALARRRGFQSTESMRRMSAALTGFFYPALIFSSLVSSFTVETLRANWLLPAGAMLIMAAGYLIGLVARRVFPLAAGRQGRNVFLFQCTINNYGFLPLPLVFMLWGEAGVALLIFSTLGSEMMVWTLGVLALTGNRVGRESVARLFNLPVLAIVSAVAVIFIRSAAAAAGRLPGPGSLPGETGAALLDVLDFFGRATVPLAMFLAGGRMAELRPRNLFNRDQFLVALLRLGVIPAAAVGLVFLLPLAGEARLILITVAVMPAAISSVVLSDVYRSDAGFAASGVLVTHLFSLLTIPLWLSFFA